MSAVKVSHVHDYILDLLSCENDDCFYLCRYPIQVPREGCYGDMDGQPGVRNYGTMDADDLFDVYCYVEQIDGIDGYNTIIMSVNKCWIFIGQCFYHYLRIYLYLSILF